MTWNSWFLCDVMWNPWAEHENLGLVAKPPIRRCKRGFMCSSWIQNFRCSLSDHQRPRPDFRHQVSLWAMNALPLLAFSSLVVAQRPRPNFENFLHVVWWLWVYNMFRFGLIICYMFGLIESWVGMIIICLYVYVWLELRMITYD